MAKQTSYVVLKTDDYSRFSIIEENRNIDPRHVKKLKGSFREHGFLVNPILVNNDLEIVDGQHRFEACKELEMPVYYLVVGDYNIEEVQALNLSQKNWTKRDYAVSFAEIGYEDYQILLDFDNEMEEFTFTSCIKLLQGATGTRTINQKRTYADRNVSGESNVKQVFEEGTWEVSSLNSAYELVGYLREIGEYYSGYSRAAFVNSIITLTNKSQFDKDEFLRKLSYQSNALSDCTGVSDYVELIEEIYNFKKRNKVNLRY